jgi:alanine racemase
MDKPIYRGTFAIVDTAAIVHNVRQFRTLLAPGTRLLVTVKAGGYGHGALLAARAALRGGADWLGTATLEEAIALREAGIDAPILVLGPVHPWSAPVAARHGVSVTLTDSPAWMDGIRFDPPLRVHLKVDTGMTRLGFADVDALLEAARQLARRPDVMVEGVFTHLACADAPDRAHADRQISRFEAALQALAAAGLRPPLAHAANSAGTLRDNAWHYDMVRVGISAYGLPPSPDFPVRISLRPALSLYSFITRVRWVDPGETVGYGATFTAMRRTRVATVPVGYADGYPRLLSNRAHAWVNGRPAPVIGRVCMDQLMLDVTDIDGVETGTCVTLYGRRAPAEWNVAAVWAQPAERQAAWLAETYRLHAADAPVLSVDELARHAETISYEIVCALSPRVPRIEAP